MVLLIVDNVLTGTGISSPDAIIAFLLLLVKTTGRLSTLNRPVESSMLTIAVSPKPVFRKTLVPPEAKFDTKVDAICWKLSKPVPSPIDVLVFREVPAI